MTYEAVPRSVTRKVAGIAPASVPDALKSTGSVVGKFEEWSMAGSTASTMLPPRQNWLAAGVQQLPPQPSGPHWRPVQSGTHAGQVPQSRPGTPQLASRGSASLQAAGMQMLVPAGKPLRGPSPLRHAEPG